MKSYTQFQRKKEREKKTLCKRLIILIRNECVDKVIEFMTWKNYGSDEEKIKFDNGKGWIKIIKQLKENEREREIFSSHYSTLYVCVCVRHWMWYTLNSSKTCIALFHRHECLNVCVCARELTFYSSRLFSIIEHEFICANNHSAQFIQFNYLCV